MPEKREPRGENLSEALLIADAQGKVVYADRRAGDLLGRAPEALLGRTLDELSLSRCELSETQLPDGARLLRARCGRGARSDGPFHESEGAFRAMAETVPDILYTAQPDGTSDFINDRLYELTGLPRGSGLGAGWTGALHPEDFDRATREWRDAVESGQPYESRHRLRSAAGGYRWYLARARPVRDESGRIARWFGCSTDIDEILRSRELLEAQRVAGVGSWWLDRKTGTFTFSDEFYRIFGRSVHAEPPHLGANEWAGHPVFSPAEYAKMMAALDRVVNQGVAYEIEAQVLRPDGSSRSILARGEAVRDHDGNVTSVRGTVLDISERKEFEEALRDAVRTKDEFLAILGHELRNPLAPIVTALQILKLQGDGRYRKALAVVERQVQHLVRLVDDLLDVSRIARGSIQLRRRPLRLQDVVAHGVETAMPLIEQRRHHLELRLHPAALALEGDESRLAQVIANLLTNAAKYTDPGGHILIEAHREGDQIVLAVKDDGIGIRAELLPRVFDLFTQERQSTDRAHGGLGLGLTIVRNLVESHGGTVEAASEGPGRGSCFTVRLPALSEEKAAIESAPPVAAEPPEAQKRILVVDDNEDALELLAEVLRGVGHEVRTAIDGPRALEALEKFPADVVILDIGLPVMDGYEVAHRIRLKYGKDAPRLIALTGYGQESDRARARAAGFAQHLTKPADVGSLLGAVAA